MRTLAHISDLHFGREDPALIRELLADLRKLEPTLVAVSAAPTNSDVFPPSPNSSITAKPAAKDASTPKSTPSAGKATS